MTIRPMIALALAATAATTAIAWPAAASAQNYKEQRRWEEAQRRYDQERQSYDRERRIYEDAQRRDGRSGYNNGRYNNGGYNNGGYNNGYDGAYNGRTYDPAGGGGYAANPDRFSTSYDASKYYRDDSRYQERRLTSDDQVYRGSDGRYYCKRNDGTTGLIIGGAAGGLFGNVVDGGRNRITGTLIGGALGALLGKKVDQNNSDVRCR